MLQSFFFLSSIGCFGKRLWATEHNKVNCISEKAQPSSSVSVLLRNQSWICFNSFWLGQPITKFVSLSELLVHQFLLPLNLSVISNTNARGKMCARKHKADGHVPVPAPKSAIQHSWQAMFTFLASSVQVCAMRCVQFWLFFLQVWLVLHHKTSVCHTIKMYNYCKCLTHEIQLMLWLISWHYCSQNWDWICEVTSVSNFEQLRVRFWRISTDRWEKTWTNNYWNEYG